MNVAPTLPIACGSLPPEGATPPALRQSRSCARNLKGQATALPAACGLLPSGAGWLGSIISGGFFSRKIK